MKRVKRRHRLVFKLLLSVGTLLFFLGGMEAGLWFLNIYPPLPRA